MSVFIVSDIMDFAINAPPLTSRERVTDGILTLNHCNMVCLYIGHYPVFDCLFRIKPALPTLPVSMGNYALCAFLAFGYDVSVPYRKDSVFSRC